MRLTHCGYLRLRAKSRIAGKRKQIAAGSRSIPDINTFKRRDLNKFEPVQNLKLYRNLIAVISQLSADNPQETAWIRSIPRIRAERFLFSSNLFWVAVNRASPQALRYSAITYRTDVCMLGVGHTRVTIGYGGLRQVHASERRKLVQLYFLVTLVRPVYDWYTIIATKRTTSVWWTQLILQISSVDCKWSQKCLS